MASPSLPFAFARRVAIAIALIVATVGVVDSVRAQSNPPPDTADIQRFLEQATWGPTPELVAHVRAVGFDAFLEEQFNAPMTGYPTLELYPTTRDQEACPNGSTCVRDNYTMYPLQTRFFRNALYGQDQLRQRVAFALHQIIVVSGVDITQPSWMAPYLQILHRGAFADFRQILYDITLNPAMGNYLDINGNSRTRPNENYAREVLQLFSIGTAMLNPDGTPQRDSSGEPIPSYDQAVINNFARVFTGLRFAPAPRTGVPNYIEPMVVNEPQHDTDMKVLLNRAVLARNRNTTQDLNDAHRQHRQPPQRRTVHCEAAHSAPGHEQPGLRLCHTGGGCLRRLQRRPRAPARRRPGHPDGSVRPPAARWRSQPSAGFVIPRSSSSTCCVRSTPAPRTEAARATAM